MRGVSLNWLKLSEGERLRLWTSSGDGAEVTIPMKPCEATNSRARKIIGIGALAKMFFQEGESLWLCLQFYSVFTTLKRKFD
jgi:hypothetical protein